MGKKCKMSKLNGSGVDNVKNVGGGGAPVNQEPPDNQDSGSQPEPSTSKGLAPAGRPSATQDDPWEQPRSRGRGRASSPSHFQNVGLFRGRLAVGIDSPRRPAGLRTFGPQHDPFVPTPDIDVSVYRDLLDMGVQSQPLVAPPQTSVAQTRQIFSVPATTSAGIPPPIPVVTRPSVAPSHRSMMDPSFQSSQSLHQPSVTSNIQSPHQPFVAQHHIALQPSVAPYLHQQPSVAQHHVAQQPPVAPYLQPSYLQSYQPYQQPSVATLVQPGGAQHVQPSMACPSQASVRFPGSDFQPRLAFMNSDPVARHSEPPRFSLLDIGGDFNVNNRGSQVIPDVTNYDYGHRPHDFNVNFTDYPGNTFHGSGPGEPGHRPVRLPPGTEHVDNTPRASAISGKYVELSEFLVVTIDIDNKEYKTFIDESGCLGVKPVKAKRQILTSFKWLEAWAVYEIIMAHAHGIAIFTEMARYRIFILSLFSKYKFPHALSYDIRHRQLIGALRSLSFNSLDDKLYVTTFDFNSLKHSSRCGKCPSTDHVTENCPFRAPGQTSDLPKASSNSNSSSNSSSKKRGEGKGDRQAPDKAAEPCFLFQDGRCKAGAKCPRRHACYGCNGTDGFKSCKKCQTKLAAS